MPKEKVKDVDVAKQYRVMNPNGIPASIPILSWQNFNWYEGDILETPEGMSVERVLREGYIKEIADG